MTCPKCRKVLRKIGDTFRILPLTRVAENPVSLSFGEMTCEKTDWLAIRCER